MSLRNSLRIAVACVAMAAVGCSSAASERTSTAPGQDGDPEPAAVGQPAQQRPERPDDWVFDRTGPDRRPSDRGAPLEELPPGSVLDLEGERLCAHLEFAFDGLIAGDTGALNRELSAAGRVARETGVEGLRSFGRQLRGQPDRPEAEAILYELLQVCVDGGYEL